MRRTVNKMAESFLMAFYEGQKTKHEIKKDILPKIEKAYQAFKVGNAMAMNILTINGLPKKLKEKLVDLISYDVAEITAEKSQFIKMQILNNLEKNTKNLIAEYERKVHLSKNVKKQIIQRIKFLSQCIFA